jgi:hypothetical protein
MALIRRLVGVHTNNPDLPVLQRDPIIDAGTLGVLDFASGWAYSAGNPGPVGARIRDLVRGAPDAVLQTQQAHDGKGFAFLGSTAAMESIALGGNWIVPADCKGFAVGIWSTIDPGGYVRAGTATVSHSLAGVRSAAGQYQWGVTLTVAYSNSAGAVTVLTARGNNTQAIYSTPPDGALHQYVTEYEVLNGGASHRVNIYIDGVKVVAGTTGTFPGTILQPGTVPVLGAVPAGSVGAHKGRTYRAWMQRLDVGGRTLAEIMAIDAANRARFV